MENNNIIKEGNASIIKTEKVFYNEAQVVNRDISIIAILSFIEIIKNQEINKINKNIDILDGLSATGIRSLRYAKEINGINSITANDINIDAVDLIKKNILINAINPNLDFKAVNNDFNKLLEKNKFLYNIIDIDPYGSASPFLQSSINSVRNGGMLCITSTDMRNFSGVSPESCFSKYGTMPLSKKYCYEMAIRILLGTIDRICSFNKRYFLPLASFSINFYIRIFIQIFDSASEAMNSSLKNGLLFVCNDCDSFIKLKMSIKINKSIKPNVMNSKYSSCNVCGGTYQFIGPIWLENIKNNNFLELMSKNSKSLLKNSQSLLKNSKKLQKQKNKKRAESLINLTKNELENSFLYFDLSILCKKIKITTPSLKLLSSVITNGGYKISRCHYKPSIIKTTAPCDFIWAFLMKLFFKEKIDKNKMIKDNNNKNCIKKINITKLAEKLMKKKFEKYEIDFTISKKGKLIKNQKFLTNKKNLGPKKKV